MQKDVSLVFAISLGFISLLEAAPVFDRIYGTDMVLPCNQPVTISGTNAVQNKPLIVAYGSVSATTKPDNKGNWKVTLPPLKPDKEGKALTVSQGDESASLDNVVVGVVWLASGQSNMLWRLNQSSTGGRDIPNAANDNIRILNSIPQAHTNAGSYREQDFEQLTAEKFYTGTWQKCTPQTAAPTSAVAYYFAKKLQESLDMPVGLIHSSLGGSEMAAWIPGQVIQSNPFYKSCRGNDWLDSPLISTWVKGRARQNMGAAVNSGTPNHPFKPGFLYDSGIEWVTKIPVSGVIWYQGESDAEINNFKQNTTLLKDIILTWRQAFGNPGLPFIMVELPRINDGSAIRKYWPEFREVQQHIAKTLPHVYCVNTIDLGSTNSDVHPPDKEPVAMRMANTALHHVYGKKDVAADGPVFDKYKISKDKVYIAFSNAKQLKTTDGKPPTEFEIAGANGKYVKAEALIDPKGYIVVSSLEIPSPKSVRYCWSHFVSPNLVNEHDLPAAQFRTDSHAGNK